MKKKTKHLNQLAEKKCPCGKTVSNVLKNGSRCNKYSFALRTYCSKECRQFYIKKDSRRRSPDKEDMEAKKRLRDTTYRPFDDMIWEKKEW